MSTKCPIVEVAQVFLRHDPELGLLAGVLEMAYRDLGVTTPKPHRQSAIKWFRSKEVDNEFPEFSFKEIVSALQLTYSQVKFIFKKVEEAEAYEQRCWDKRQEERIKSGIGIGPLDERERRKIRQENAAILRERRNERRSSPRRLALFSY